MPYPKINLVKRKATTGCGSLKIKYLQLDYAVLNRLVSFFKILQKFCKAYIS